MVLHNISSYKDFFQSYTKGLISRFQDPNISKGFVLLPNRFAVEQCKKAFGNLNLDAPKILSIGSLFYHPDSLPFSLEEKPKIYSGNPVVHSIEMLFKVQDKIKDCTGERDIDLKEVKELCILINQLIEGNVNKSSFDNFLESVDYSITQQWSRSLSLLRDCYEFWLYYLKDNDLTSQVEYKKSVAQNLGKFLLEDKGAAFISIAGSMVSNSYMRDLVSNLNEISNGLGCDKKISVVLQNFDSCLMEKNFDHYLNKESSHQHSFALLIKRLGLDKSFKINEWDLYNQEQDGEKIKRQRRINSIFHHGDLVEEGMRESNSIELFNCANRFDEVELIVNKIIDANHHKKNIALISEDKELIERTSLMLKRENIEVEKLSDYEDIYSQMEFFLLCAQVIFGSFDHKILLKLLCRKECKTVFNDLAGHLYIKITEGNKYAFVDWHKSWREYKWDFNSHELQEAFDGLCSKIEGIKKYGDGDYFWSAQKDFALWLSGEEDKDSLMHDRADCQEQAQSLTWVNYLNKLEGVMDINLFSKGNFSSWIHFLEEMLDQHKWAWRSYEKPCGEHWVYAGSFIDLRISNADLIIMGDMNNYCNFAPLNDAFLKFFNLENSVESDFGLMKHDFVSLLAKGHVIVTRSVTRGDKSLEPSDLVLYAKPIIDKEYDYKSHYRHEVFVEENNMLDGARFPKKLFVKDIELLIQNPYAFYANKILKLEKLGTLDCNFSPSKRGLISHEILKDFVDQYGSALRNKSIDKCKAEKILIEMFEGRLNKISHLFIGDLVLEKASLLKFAKNFVIWESERFDLSKIFLERNVSFSITSESSKSIWHISGRVDRIEVTSENSIRIIDYKTGSLPAKKNIENGLYAQLWVYALAVARGAIPELNGLIDHIDNFELIYLGSKNKGDKLDQVSLCVDREKLNQFELALSNLFDGYDKKAFDYLWSDLGLYAGLEYKSIFNNGS